MPLEGSRGHIINSKLSVLVPTAALTACVLWGSTAYTQGTPPIHECDRLAAYPEYAGSVDPGTSWNQLNPATAIRACQTALDMYPGETRFLFQLGRVHLKAEDYEKALPLLTNSAALGFVPAYLGLSLMYENGWGVSKDSHQAFEWAKKAAETGFAPGQFRLAQIYYSGIGVEKDYAKAFDLTSSAAVQNYSHAQHGLGQLYLRGHGVEQDYSKAAEWFKSAANKGHAQAQNDLGSLYFDGLGVPQDRDTAVQWIRKAATSGNLEAQTNLGFIFSGNMGYPANFSEAFKWAKMAAERGSPQAQGDLGFLYQEGMGTERSFENAAYWYRKAAEQGFAFAQVKLGLLYADGTGVEKDVRQAAKWFQKAAEKGDASGSYFYADAYYYGKGVSKDRVEAAKWFEKAAEKGHSFSQYLLATMLRDGDGIPKNLKKGFEWLRKAAENNEPLAQKRLGDVYRYGTGVEKNIDLAMHWYRQAADQGNLSALTQLASLYFNGEGVNKDLPKAFGLYLKAAKRGDTHAEYVIGSMYLNGEGVEKNFDEAKEWSLKAAMKGNDFAQNSLGYMYLEGFGVEKNYQEALKWFIKAIEKDNVHALISIAHMLENGYGVRQSYQKAVGALLKAGRIALSEKTYDGERAADVLERLIGLYDQMGKYFLAEDSAKNLLVVWEQVRGTEDKKVAQILTLLAGIYFRQGRYEEAKGVFQRVFSILSEVSSEDSAELRWLRVNASRILAKIHHDQGDFTKGEELYLHALELSEPLKSDDLDAWAGILANYGELLTQMEKFQRAESVLKQSKDAIEEGHGKDHPFSVLALANLAKLYRRTGQYEKAEQNFQKAWRFVRELGVEEHPLVALGLADFAAVYEAKGETEKALGAIRTAAQLYLQRLQRARKIGSGAVSRGVATERNLVRRVFEKHADLVLKESKKQGIVDEKLVDEAFMAGQLASYVSAGDAISKMSLRFSAKDQQLATLIRKRQDAQERWNQLDRTLQFGAGTTNKISARDIKLIRTELPTLKSKIKEFDRQIAAAFPAYARLTAVQPNTLANVRDALRENEALVKWTVGRERTLLWVITRKQTQAYHLSITKEKLNEAVAILRSHLDPTSVTSLDDLLSFPLETAYQLYSNLLGAAGEVLQNYTHLIVVPDAGLQSLPLGVLITESTNAGRRGNRISSINDFRNVAWLARRFAITVMPSVRSLVSLRSVARQSNATRPFIGFGDPSFGGKGQGGKVRAVAHYFTQRGAVDPRALKGLPELPETADELKELATYLGADLDDIYTRDRATEAIIKKKNLASYRVIAFATHGLVSGDLSGLAEPALVMTLPKKATTEDDGLLTASEISRLELDSELVILSACNTAAPGAEPGAESLSGLATAFFFAGSRALLVSHWPVISDAAKRLTTGMFEHLRSSPEIGRAEALRRSMISLLENDYKDHFAHPILWAPFVVVGEGGAYAFK